MAKLYIEKDYTIRFDGLKLSQISKYTISNYGNKYKLDLDYIYYCDKYKSLDIEEYIPYNKIKFYVSDKMKYKLNNGYYIKSNDKKLKSNDIEFEPYIYTENTKLFGRRIKIKL